MSNADQRTGEKSVVGGPASIRRGRKFVDELSNTVS